MFCCFLLFFFFKLYFREVRLAILDNSHEMASLIFYEQYKKINMTSGAVVIHSLSDMDPYFLSQPEPLSERSVIV